MSLGAPLDNLTKEDLQNCLFFPEPWEAEDGCPPESVIKAYLKGE
jgi:hypothetical protein